MIMPVLPVTEWSVIRVPALSDWPDDEFNVSHYEARYLVETPQFGANRFKVRMNCNIKGVANSPVQHNASYVIYDGNGLPVQPDVGSHYAYTGRRVTFEVVLPTSTSVLHKCIVDSFHASGVHIPLSLDRDSYNNTGRLGRE